MEESIIGLANRDFAVANVHQAKILARPLLYRLLTVAHPGSIMAYMLKHQVMTYARTLSEVPCVSQITQFTF